ncbi:lantibiotic ABC transporter ATP-binding protein [Solibacillus sp. R5-41]|uniref:ABC transporter ATP-binding protein n=1 Tax=Solibacillus sp. R5-41 TaxID=2048654 RepID=UPI000C1272CF|nr:ABC transporter ATP-binding protein [Solibacillus sp. R5-41]ATP39316.1 lantibiotic ABC transporter ATP-binding protein [Solibacillus sp. R5-41]
MIELINLSKRYKGYRGLGPINYKIKPGKITALVGENGAGKSTLIKLLMRQIQPEDGTITGIDSHRIRFMPDDLEFPTTLKINEIMKLLGQLKKCSDAEQQRILHLVGLERATNDVVRNLSKGMRQRLNWAQSMLGESDLYILDEPTNGLDPYWISKLKKQLLQEKEQGQTILFSTHLLATVDEIADEVLMIQNGEAILAGSVQQVKAQYGVTNLEQLWLMLRKDNEG